MYPKCIQNPLDFKDSMLEASESPKSRPLANLHDAHAPVRLPAYRDLVQPRSRVQAGTKSVAAPLVSAHASNVEVLSDLQPVDAVGDLAVRARLLDPWTEIRMLQSDAPFVAARDIDNLPGRVEGLAISSQSPCCFVGENFPIANRVVLPTLTFSG